MSRHRSHGAARLTLQPFDPGTASPEAWQRLHAYRRLRQQEDWPGEPALSDEAFEAELRQSWPLSEQRRTMAVRQDGEFVGNLILAFRRAGSPGSEDFAPHVDVWGGVLGPQRRQGVGRALLGALLAFMEHQGRTLATFKVHLPESHAFLTALGAQEKYRSIENRLALAALDWDALAHWQTQATAIDSGLRWELHAGRVPMARLATLLAPLSALINEQPLDALELPRLRYELPGYEAWYADMDRRGGMHFLVLLRHGDALAAVCDAHWDARFPERVQQQLTAVAGPWRGRGLAKAVKAAMLQLIRQHLPQASTVVTLNAQSNAPMLAINRRLGFAAHRHDGTYQLTREALAGFLAAR